MKTITTNTPLRLTIHQRLWPYLQRIQDAVRTGHTRCVQGQIDPAKAQRLWTKCDALYAVSASAARRHKLRKQGYAIGRLLLYKPQDSDKLDWCLLITEGEWLAIDPRENWQSRPTWRELECLRLPKPGCRKPPVTWRIQPKQLDQTADWMINLVRTKQDVQLQAAIDTLWRLPGFAGIRTQLVGLKRRLQGEWVRRRGGEGGELEFPVSFYLTRQA